MSRFEDRALALTPSLPAPRLPVAAPAGLTAAEPGERLRVHVRPNPFDRSEDYVLLAPAGETLEALVARAFRGDEAFARPFAVVAIDGHVIPPALWPRVRPFSTATVAIALRPRGGEGNKILAAVLTVVVFAAALFLGPAIAGSLGFQAGTFAFKLVAGLVSGAVTVLGNLLVNALVGPPQNGLREPERNPWIDGARNQIRRGQPIEVLFGRHRVYPSMLGEPYREIVGDDVYLRFLVCWGPGPIALEQLKIGETDLSTYEGVEIEHRLRESDDPHLLYASDIQEDGVGVTLAADGGAGPWTQRTTRLDTIEIGVLIAFPQGLGARDKKGKEKTHSVTVEFRYRRHGTADNWTTIRPSVDESAAGATALGTTPRNLFSGGVIGLVEWSQETRDLASAETAATYSSGAYTFSRAKPAFPFARLARWAVPKGQYDVEVRRVTPESDDINTADDVQWAGLQSTSDKDPAPNRALASTAVRIKATDQLQGVVDTLNGVARRLCPVLDAAAVAGPDPDYTAITAADWATEGESRNPADQALFLLRGPMAATPPADAEIDWPAWAAFWVWCEEEGWTFDRFQDGGARREDVLRMICAAGRAIPHKTGGRWTVTVDAPRAGGPVQVLSDGNSANLRHFITYPAEVHAFRVTYADEDYGWREAERYIYADGYDASNATKIETLDIPGVTDAELIWRLGRFFMATATNVRERFVRDLDVEQMAFTFGDLVAVQSEVLLVSLGSPRVEALVAGTGANAGKIAGLVLDAPVALEAGKSYAVRLRFIETDAGTGLSRIVAEEDAPIAGGDGEVTTITFATARASADAPQRGDLVIVGETGKVALECLVKAIRPGQNLGAQIECVPYAPERFGADEGTIPSFDPGITLPGETRPPTPTLVAVQADRTGMFVTFAIAPGVVRRAVAFTARWRITPEGLEERPWTKIADLGEQDRTAIFPAGEPGLTYDFEIVAIGADGQRSLPLIVAGVDADERLDAPEDFAVAAASSVGPTGVTWPVFEVSWDAQTDPYVERIEIELSAAGAGVWLPVAAPDAASGVVTIAGIQPGATYDVSGRFISRRGVKSDRVIVEDVTAANVFRATEALAAAVGGAIETALDTLDAAQADLEAGLGALETEMVGVRAAAANNLVADPTFALGLHGWLTSGAAIEAIDPGVTPAGIHIQTIAAAAGVATVLTWAGRWSARPGERLEIGADVVLADAGSSVQHRARFSDAGGADLGTLDAGAAGAGGRLGGFVTPPADAYSFMVESALSASAAGEAGWTLHKPHVGRASVTQTSLSPFIDPADPRTLAILEGARLSEDIAERATLIEIDAGNARARIATVETAVVTETAARAAAITIIEAEIAALGDDLDTANAAITTANAAIVDLEANKAEASALTALTARVTSAEGDIVQAEATLIEHDTAIVNLDATKAEVSALTALTARVGDEEAQTAIFALAIADLEGKTAAYLTLTVAAGGAVGVISLASGEGVSSISFAADAISIWNETTAQGDPVFEVVAGVTRIKQAVIPDLTTVNVKVGTSVEFLGSASQIRVKDTQATPVTRVLIGKLGSEAKDYGFEVRNDKGQLVVGADGLGLNAAIYPASVLSTAVVTLPGTSAQDPGDWIDLPLTMNTKGGQVTLTVNVTTRVYGGQGALAAALILRRLNGPTLVNEGYVTPSTPSNYGPTQDAYTVNAVDTPPAGRHTYQLRLRRGTPGKFEIVRRFLSAYERRDIY